MGGREAYLVLQNLLSWLQSPWVPSQLFNPSHGAILGF